MMTLNKKKQKYAGTIIVMTEALKLAETNLEKALAAVPQDPKVIEAAKAAVEYRKADLAKQQAFKVRKAVR